MSKVPLSWIKISAYVILDNMCVYCDTIVILYVFIVQISCHFMYHV